VISGLTGAILMGGDSRRMGRDKAGLLLNGRPLVHHVHDILATLVDDILLVTRPGRLDHDADLAPPGCRVVTDVLPARGPLVGLHAALREAATERVLLVGCDMPCLRPALLRAMAGTPADVTIARLSAGFEPLHAFYARACLAPIEQALAGGAAPITALFSRVQMNIWDEARVRRLDPGLRSFLNINTPEDLAALD
jgi:molybdopterin-guanine dinucleotide biosynthesis protein A